MVSESVINTDVLIETFIENTYDESDDSEKPDIDPFASVSATLPLQPADNEKPKQNVIEQTLF